MRYSITRRWNYHLLVQPGYVMVLSDYRGSTGYGERFTLDILGPQADAPLPPAVPAQPLPAGWPGRLSEPAPFWPPAEEPAAER